MATVVATDKMTKEDMILLGREWFDHYGEPPRLIDWNPALARRKGRFLEADRFDQDGCWPRASEIVNEFGTFTHFIIATGFYPRVRTKVWLETPPSGRSDYLRAAIAVLKASGGADELR